MTAYRYPSSPPEALTLARRLDRAGLTDADNASTADWIATLHRYEELMATATRMATFKQRTIDLDGLVLEPDDAALTELAARVAALDAHAARMRAAVSYLDGLLDKYQALPRTADAEGAAWALARRYIARRVRVAGGPTVTLADLLPAAWSLVGRVRESYRLLSPAGKADAVASWGPFEDANGFGPLWNGRAPTAAIRALDARAATLGVMRDKRGL